MLPCRYCRDSYQDFIKQPGSELTKITMKNRKNLVTWLYHIHNKVNKKLGIKDKPITGIRYFLCRAAQALTSAVVLFCCSSCLWVFNYRP